MSPTPEVLLDDVFMDASAGWGWTFSAGVDPTRRIFTCARVAAQAVFANAKPKGSTLVMRVPGGGDLTVEKLTVLGIGPGPSPDQATLEVADLRYLWTRRRVKASFNMRRRTGERRRLNPGALPAIAQIVDDIAFAPWSINGGARWTPAAMLRRVLNELLELDERFELRQLPNLSLPVETLVIDDEGGGALKRALGYLGGVVDVFIDADGTVVIFDRTDGSERELVGLTGGRSATRTRGGIGPPTPSVVGPPLWALQDRSLERAVGVQVLFSRLAELRFDAEEGPAGIAASATAVAAGNQEAEDVPLDMDNVLPVTDLTLFIPAVDPIFGFLGPARTVLQGTWITIPEALAAWNLLGWPNAALGPLTLETLRLEVIGPGLIEFAPPLLDQAGVAQRRIQALRTHYRQTYRLVRRWRDRLGDLLARRAELRDAENGTSAPAEAYANWAEQLAERGAEHELAINPAAVALVRNRFPVAPPATIKATAIPIMQPSPAVVTIEDQDEGVIRLNFAPDPTGRSRAVVFSALDADSIGRADPTDDVLLFDNGRLTREHQVSVVLSTIAVAPNDRRQFHAEIVTPAQVKAQVKIDPGNSVGPRVVLRVNPMNGRAVARFAWDDARATEIRLAFAFKGEDAGDPTTAFGQPLNPEELRALALDAAARHYARLLDHIEGNLTTGFAPNLRPTGAASSVGHLLDTDGRPLTTVGFLRDLPAPDTFALLPEHVRQVVLAEVSP